MKKILLFIMMLILINCKDVMAHEHSGYSHESNVGYENKNWMSNIPDSRLLSQLSVPGTHDSMSLYGGDIVQTQSMSLDTQLNSGIRYLDIRCRYLDEGAFSIHHGQVYQNAMFGDVLNTASDFLAKNPTETILMRVKQEYSSVGNDAFNALFLSYVKRYPNLFWDNKGDCYGNPTLGEMRGKVVVLYDVSQLNFGLSYRYALNKQDDYNLSTNWDLYSKWIKMKAHIQKAAESPNDGTIYLNYLSGSGGAFPYFVASGHSNPATGAPRLATGFTTPGWEDKYPDFPRVDEFLGIKTIAFEGTNVLATNFINGSDYSRVGIIAADFPGKGLINSIITRNYNKSTEVKLLGLGDNEFGNLKVDFNKLTLKTNAGQPHVYFSDSYLNLEVLDENNKQIYNKDFVGNQNYDAEIRKIDIKEGYRIKITSKEPVRVKLREEFQKDCSSLEDTVTIFIITKDGLKKGNKNNSQIRFLGLGDNEFGNLKVDLDFNKLTLKTNEGQPHVYFSDSYLNLEVLDENNKQIYNKDFVGNQNYEAEIKGIDIKEGYKIKITSKEPVRVNLGNIFNNERCCLKDTVTIFTITKDGLKK